MTNAPSESRLRMAVIGCGPIGLLHARAIADSQDAELVGVCDVDAARREDAQRRFDIPAYASIRRLLTSRQPNALTIATPDHLHLEPALDAIEAGCHLFCEKPLAASVTDAATIVHAAAAHNVLLAVYYNRRFASGYGSAHEMLVTGKIGHLKHCLINVADPTPPPRVAREPFVILFTLLTHHFDLVRWYGGEIYRLHARADEMRRGLLSRVSISLDLVSAASATVVAAYDDDQRCTVERLVLKGSTGSVVVDNLGHTVTYGDPKLDDTATTASGPSAEDAIAVSILAHVGVFINCAAAGRQPPVTGHDGLVGLKLATAAVESITNGESIEIAQ